MGGSSWDLAVTTHPIGVVRQRQFPAEPPLTRRALNIRFGCMPARWGSFAIGLGLILAPLVLGYGSPGLVVHDVAMGLLVCVATLAAFEWPRARFALAIPALWLVAAGRTSGDAAAAAAELGAGGLLLALALVPSTRRTPHPAPPLAPPPGRAGARA